MTSTCFFFLRNEVKSSSVKCTTSVSSSDQSWLRKIDDVELYSHNQYDLGARWSTHKSRRIHTFSGGGGGGGSLGSFMKAMILSPSRSEISKVISPFLKYLSVGKPLISKRSPRFLFLVTSTAANLPLIWGGDSEVKGG